MSHVLILNAGSSSLKWSVLDSANESLIDQGNRSWEGGGLSRHAAEVDALVQRMPAVDTVGHRVVHGGAIFREAVIVTGSVRARLATLSDLAPLHNPAALAGIDAIAASAPSLPQIAAFDTAFHATIPDESATYAIPWAWTERWGLRRYGFHGLSVAYAVRRTAQLLGFLPMQSVVCHLGAGCSVTAVREGRSVDTSMGFTPQDGVMMATRPGALNPGLLTYIISHQHVNASELDSALNEGSGLLGVSGVSADLRKVLAAKSDGSARATLAYGMFVHSLVRMVGAMTAVLGGLDALVFTGGIGEHSSLVRSDVSGALHYAGLDLSADKNEGQAADVDIAATGSGARVLVITAREDLTVLSEVRRLLWRGGNGPT